MEAGGATIHLNRFEEWPAARGYEEAARRAVRETLAGGGPEESPPVRCPGEAEISVTCLSAAEIRRMNRRYLSRDDATDVIAFDLSEEGRLLGDVYLSPEIAGDQARERDIDPRRELLRLVIHGVLHVLGWDHPGGAGREDSAMYRRQEAILERVVGPAAAPGGDGTGRDDPDGDGPRGGSP